MLLGDLASYSAWPDVTGKYLMVPSPTGQVGSLLRYQYGQML